jgi:quinol monooxygenase YgiN
MYAQKAVLQAPLGKIGELRRLIGEKYLPVVRKRPGFIAAFLMEQVDDPDSAELLLLWSSQAAVEHFHNTGLLQASIQTISADLPGLKIERQGYIIRLTAGSETVQEPVSAAAHTGN